MVCETKHQHVSCAASPYSVGAAALCWLVLRTPSGLAIYNIHLFYNTSRLLKCFQHVQRSRGIGERLCLFVLQEQHCWRVTQLSTMCTVLPPCAVCRQLTISLRVSSTHTHTGMYAHTHTHTKVCIPECLPVNSHTEIQVFCSWAWVTCPLSPLQDCSRKEG